VQFRDAQGQPTTPPRSLDVTVEASSPDGPPQRQRSFVYDSFTASAASAPASGGVGVATLISEIFKVVGGKIVRIDNSA
jgi:hypothetical protein